QQGNLHHVSLNTRLIDRPSRFQEVRKENRVSRGEPCGPLPGTPMPPRGPATEPCVPRGESPCDRTSAPAGGRAQGRCGTGGPEGQSAPRTALFFRYWRLKEAYVKARGLGLSLPIERCEFAVH